MKKFLGNLLVYMAIIVGITLTINSLFIKLDKSDSDYINKFNKIPDSIDVCNFGSSHGLYGFNYEDVERNGYSCFNFALESQYISYDYRLIQQYGNHIGEDTIVFIPVSYFSFFGIDEEYYEDFDSKNKRYYPILSSELIKNYEIKTNIYVNYLPALGADTSYLIKVLTGKSASSDENDYNWMREASDIDVLENAKAAYERHLVYNKLDDSENRILNNKEIDALYELIDYCKGKGAVPILVTTPYLTEYTDEVKNSSPDFYDVFYSIIDDVRESTGVEYFDYSFDERFSHSYKLFMNADHLNKEGARQFTNILMEEATVKGNYDF